MDNQSSKGPNSFMIETEANRSIISKWQAIYDENRPLLKPNKKSAEEVIRYLQEKYPIITENSAEAKEVATFNIAEGLKHSGTEEQQDPSSFQIITFKVQNERNGANLYRTQQQDYLDVVAEFRKIHDDAQDIPADDFPMPILVNVEINSGFIYVEGSPALSNEIELFQGHNAKELENIYTVACYVKLLKKAGQL